MRAHRHQRAGRVSLDPRTVCASLLCTHSQVARGSAPGSSGSTGPTAQGNQLTIHLVLECLGNESGDNILTQRTVPPTPAKSPPLLVELWGLLEKHCPAFRQERPFRRMQALILGHLFGFARRTITQALVALGLTDHDWSAFYRLFNEPRIDYEILTSCFLAESLDHMPATAPYVAVVDGVQIPRHSHKMPGTSWLKNPRTPPFKPGSHRAQRFLHLAALLPRTEEGYSRALPLR